jgi:hypothetical protein
VFRIWWVGVSWRRTTSSYRSVSYSCSCSFTHTHTTPNVRRPHPVFVGKARGNGPSSPSQAVQRSPCLLLPRWLDPAAFCQPKTHSLDRRVWRYDSIKNPGSGATTVLHSLRRYGNTAELQGDTSILYDPLTRAKDLRYLLQQKVISAKRIICHALGLTTKKKYIRRTKRCPQHSLHCMSLLILIHQITTSSSHTHH